MNNDQTAQRVNCQVILYPDGDIMVDFEGNEDSSLYLWKNDNMARFGVDCGIIEAPTDWDRTHGTLDYDWWNADWESITECPEKYKEQVGK